MAAAGAHIAAATSSGRPLRRAICQPASSSAANTTTP